MKNVKDNTSLTKTYKKPKKDRVAIPKKVREAVLKRDGAKCHYCNETTTTKNRHLDHVNGDRSMSVAANLVVACKRCNTTKSDTKYMEYIIKTISRLEKHLANLKKLRS